MCFVGNLSSNNFILSERVQDMKTGLFGTRERLLIPMRWLKVKIEKHTFPCSNSPKETVEPAFYEEHPAAIQWSVPRSGSGLMRGKKRLLQRGPVKADGARRPTLLRYRKLALMSVHTKSRYTAVS
jgi:hypothetical protein